MDMEKTISKLKRIMILSSFVLCMIISIGIKAKAATFFVFMGNNINLDQSSSGYHYSYNADNKTFTISGTINYMQNSVNDQLLRISGIRDGLTIVFADDTTISTLNTIDILCELININDSRNITIKSGNNVNISTNVKAEINTFAFNFYCSDVLFDNTDINVNGTTLISPLNGRSSYAAINSVYSCITFKNAHIAFSCNKENGAGYCILMQDKGVPVCDMYSNPSQIIYDGCSLNYFNENDTRYGEIAPIKTYLATVNYGTGGSSYAAGANVTITADAPASGKRFKEWTGTDGLTFTSGSKTSLTATFLMPAREVSVTATYEDISIYQDNNSETNQQTKSENVDKKQKTTSLSKLKSGKKSFSVTWKKQSAKGIKGYEIQYSTDKGFKKDVTKTVTIKKAKTTKTTIKKLKSKTKYYVRIRTFSKKNGEKVYSNWSKVKSVKVK